MDPAALMNVMITDDGNTLLTVRRGNDGSLELLTTPVTIVIVQNNSDDALESQKDPNNDIILNQSLQLKLNSFQSNTTQQHNLSPIEILDFESSDFQVYNENTYQSTEAINNILHKNLKYNSTSGMQNGTEVSQTGVEQNLEKTHVAAPQETSICLEKSTSPKKHARKGQKGPKKCKKTPDKKQECFKCDVCGQELKNQYLKQKHMHEHTQEKPHHCPKCPASFNIPTNFTLHMATHNIGEPKCPECGRKFARMASLKSHMIAHELDENLYCTECDDVFETRAQLDNHLKLHNEKCSNDEYKKCKICRKQFTQPVLYLQHLRDHYKLQMKSTKQTRRGIRHRTTYKCRLCLKAFEKPSQLARHIRVHTGEKPYKCNLCNRSFTQKGSVRIHMWQHNGIRPYSCSFCNAKFSQKGNLNAHVLRAHKVQEGSPMYRCTQCPCIFKKLGSLNGHMKRAHSDTKSRNADDEELEEEANEEEVRADPVLSERCVNEDNQVNGENNAGDELPKNFEEGFVVTDNSEQTAVVTLLDKMSNDAKGKYIQLKQRFVNNSRLYECSFCDKTFKKPSDLMRHLRIHTLEKPFKCNTCSRSFTLKSTMLSHERTHTSSTIKYPCSKCDKFFKSAKALASHEKIHSTKCSFCDQEFSTFDELKEHSTMHVDSMKHRSKDSQKNKYTPEVQNLAPKVILKEPLVLTELSSGLLHAQPKFRNEIAHGQFRPHKCPACPAAFMKLSHLKQHHRKHTGERPFMCTLCNRAFSTNSALKTHRRIHESSKPYKCSICNTHFSTLSSMKRHRFTHSNKRPYMCPYCNKTFKTTVNCRKHMKIHKQEIAQQQLELQKKQKQQSVAIDSPTNRLTTMTTTQPIIMNDQEITFQPISNNLTQDLNDQLQTLIGDKSFLGISPTSQNNNVTEQNIPIVENPNICTTQTLHADETGTVTLSNYTGDQTLKPESIREIEETLNQQLFSIGMNLALNSTVRQIEQQNNSPFETRDQPVLSIIYDNGKTLESPLNQCVNSNVFSSQFDTFDMNQITLQADHELDMAIAQANSTNMTNILTNSNQENQHYNPQFLNNNFETNVVLGQNDLNRDSQINNSTVFNEKKQSSNVQTDKDLSKENNLQCHICNVGQFNTEDLKQHLKTHQGSRKFECSYCHSKFCTSGGLSRHVKIHESQETHKCYECKQEFSTTLQLREHIKEHVKNELKLKNLTEFDDISIKSKSKNNEAGDKKSNECQYCSKTFRKPSDLVRHLRTHTGERPYQCQYCNKSFAVKCTLDSHLKIHSGEKSFYCHVCSTMFASKGSLKVHMRLHTGDKPFDCSMCNMKFRTSGHRKVHMRSHARELNKAIESESKKQPISTATQNDQSGQLQDNGNAQILHTIAEPQQITQQIGGHDQNLGPITINSVSDQITFNTDGTTLNDTTELVTLNDDNQLVANLPFFLANGLVTIRMEDPAISSQLQLTSTELVDNDFVSTNISEKLNDQMHGPQVIFTSEVPNDGSGVTDANQFSLNNCLVLQLDNVDSTMPDTTTGNSPKQTKALSTATRRECDICGKAFAKPCQVERHKRVHTGERPFQCDLCNKNFSQKSSLQMHRKRHTGDRPYPCSQCDRTFIQSGNLQTHLKRVHKIDPVEIKRLIKGQQFVNYSPKLLEQDIEDNRVLGFDDFSIGELLE